MSLTAACGSASSTPLPSDPVQMVASETEVKGFGLERSDLIAICVGVIVALVLYLEPQKSASVVLACLLLLACCVAYLLFHWFAKWPWIRNAGTKEKKVRLLAACVSAVVLMALYGTHVWPHEDQTAKKIEQVLLGEEFDPQKLASQFPLGYVVFRLENNDMWNSIGASL